jgi:hypothetical protein
MVAIAAADNANGTVTFTVTGASGTVNIYGAAWSGGLVNPTYSLLATRSGNGTVNATLANGIYQAYAVNVTDFATMIGFRVTDGEDPFATQVCNAVVSKLQALSLSGITGSNIVRRKLPLAEDLTLPGILVTLQGENDLFDVPGSTNERDNVDYQVQIVMLYAGNRDNRTAAQMELHDLWRQQIAMGFRNQPLPACGAYRVTVERRTIYFSGDFQFNYDTHALLLHCVRRESRGVT